MPALGTSSFPRTGCWGQRYQCGKPKSMSSARERLWFRVSLFVSAQFDQCPSTFHSKHNRSLHTTPVQLCCFLEERGVFVLPREVTVFPFPLLALMVHLLESHVPHNSLSFSKPIRKKALKQIYLFPWLLNLLDLIMLFFQSLAEVHEF